jgi:hypothetical protein
MNPYLKALQNRLQNGDITQEEYNHFAELLKEPEPEPIPIPQPTEIEMMRDYVLDVDYRLVMIELGLL